MSQRRRKGQIYSLCFVANIVLLVGAQRDYFIGMAHITNLRSSLVGYMLASFISLEQFEFAHLFSLICLQTNHAYPVH